MLKLGYNLYCTTTFVSLDGALYEVSWLELIETHLVLTTVLLPAVDFTALFLFDLSQCPLFSHVPLSLHLFTDSYGCHSDLLRYIPSSRNSQWTVPFHNQCHVPR